MNNKKKASPWKAVQVGLLTLLALVIFAYGCQITKVNLEELRSENRQQSLIRVTRALAQPDILEYDQVEEVVNQPVYVPCSQNVTATPADQNTSEPYIV